MDNNIILILFDISILIITQSEALLKTFNIIKLSELQLLGLIVGKSYTFNAINVIFIKIFPIYFYRYIIEIF